MATRLKNRIPYPGMKPATTAELAATELGVQYLLHCTSKGINEYFDLYKSRLFAKSEGICAEAINNTNGELSEWLSDLEVLSDRLSEICQRKLAECAQ